MELRLKEFQTLLHDGSVAVVRPASKLAIGNSTSVATCRNSGGEEVPVRFDTVSAGPQGWRIHLSLRDGE